MHIDYIGIDCTQMRDGLSEKEAISRANKGDYDAQRYLYDKYRSKWYMICLRYLPNRFDAEDALQNGLIHIFTKLDQFDPALGEFGSWTSRIIANDCLLIIRNNHKNLVVQELDNDLPIYAPEENALDKLSREDIMKMIQKLPMGYRIIFNMYVFEGYSHKEIADQLNITEGTSKSQLFKARKMLQQALELMI